MAVLHLRRYLEIITYCDKNNCCLEENEDLSLAIVFDNLEITAKFYNSYVGVGVGAKGCLEQI